MRHGRKKPTADPQEIRIRIALSFGVVLSFVAALAGPSNWLWGMNLLRYYPMAVGVSVLSVGLALIWLLPPLDDEPVRRFLARRRLPILPLLSAVIAGFVFFLFRVRSHLLGDGLEILRRLHQNEIPAPRSTLFNLLEPAVYRLFTTRLGLAEEPGAAFLSVLSGVVAVFLALFFFQRLAERRGAPGVVIAALFLLTGTMQLFFGYVETYPLLAASTLVFYAAAFDALTAGSDRERRPGLIAALAALGVALVAHPFAVAFLPGGVLLVCLRSDGSGVTLDRNRLFKVGLAVVAVPVLLAIAFELNPAWRGAGSAGRFLAPQEYVSALYSRIGIFGQSRPWADRYRTLSAVHFADQWNSLWIAGGAAFCFALGAVSRRIFAEPAGWFGLSGFILMVLIRFLWRTPLGAMRDWDLFSGLGFAAAGLAAAAVLTGAGKRLALPAAAAGLCLLIPWILIQADTSRAARRHFDGIDAEPRPEPYVEAAFHQAMGDRFGRSGEFDLAARAYGRAIEIYPRYEYAWRLGTVNLARGRYAEAATALTKALELRPKDTVAMLELGTARIGAGDFAAARAILDEAIVLYPQSGGARLRRARVEIAAGNVALGRRLLDEARAFIPAGSVDDRDLRDLEAWLVKNAGGVPSPVSGGAVPVDTLPGRPADRSGSTP